jgi:hypothetical protein
MRTDKQTILLYFPFMNFVQRCIKCFITRLDDGTRPSFNWGDLFWPSDSAVIMMIKGSTVFRSKLLSTLVPFSPR